MSRTRARRPPARGPRREDAGPAAATGPRPRSAAARSLFWAAAGPLALLALWWASRTPTLGVPVADDYLFLSQVAFERPLDWLGPMGATCYWRPVSRQLYFLLTAPWLPRSPWLAPLLAALLFLGLYATLHRLARRGLPLDARAAGPAAAAIACFPLLSEPSRVLLAWPSAAQHLLGAVFVALAVERAAAGRRLAAAAAALLALLSNEATALVLPALPILAWFRTRSRNEVRRCGAVAAGVAALWALGYAAARVHGAGLPAGAGRALPIRAGGAVLVQALAAQLGFEDLPPAPRGWLLGLYGALLVGAVLLSWRRAARRRIARAGPALLGGLVWFVAGAAPLAFLLPDWNAWRTTVPALGLGFALTGWLALAAPPLAGGLVALRLLALLLAQPAPGVVAAEPPPTASSFSLPRLVRLQRVVESTRRELLARAPSLPRGAVVRFTEIPLLAEVGFNGENAPRVWYRDRTLSWRSIGEARTHRVRADAVIEFEPHESWPATWIEPEAFRLFRVGYAAGETGDFDAADSLFGAAERALGGRARAFRAGLTRSRAWMALNRRDYAAAESLTRLLPALDGESAPYWALRGWLAAVRGDLPAARDALGRCLALDSDDRDGVRLAGALERARSRP